MAITHDTVGIHGHGLIEVHDAATGELLHSQRYTNVITNYARTQIIRSFRGNGLPITVTHIGIGTSGTAPLATDTALGNEVYRAVPTSQVDYSPTELGFKLFVSASQANGSTLREIGLFDASSGGNMMARSTSFTPIAKNASITVTFTHIIRYN
jgi:hypothetical protein